MDKQNEKGSYKNVPYILKMLWEADKPYVTMTLLHRLIGSMAGLILSVYMTQFVFRAIEGAGTFEQMVWSVFWLCMAHVVVHIVSAVAYRMDKTRLPNIYKSIYTKVIDVSIKMDYTYFEQSDFYDKFTRALGESVERGWAVLDACGWCFGAVFTAVMSVIVVAGVDFKLMFFIIVPLVLSVAFGRRIPKLYYDLNMETTRDVRIYNYSKRVFYEKKYAGELRLYNIKNVLLKNHNEAFDNVYEKTGVCYKKLFRINVMVNLSRALICVVAPYAYIYYLSVNEPNLDLGAYIAAATAAIGFVAGRLQWGLNLFFDMRKQTMFIDNLREFLDYKSPSQNKNAEKTCGGINDIVIENMGFTYEGAEIPALDGINMTIKRGEKIAVVGYNGAGKTTLVKLLMGLYPVSSGCIKANGENINIYEPKSYRKKFGTVFQDLQVFALTIAENVLMKKPENDEERRFVTTALEKAQFGDTLSGLEKGIDTVVSREFDEKGLVLSGGGTQKIAIARVFAKNPDIVILDEPSSALDPIAEYKMFENMMNISGGKTVIFISHRLSSARVADRIYLLDGGKIAEQGTHDELMDMDGKYAEMFRLQSSNYIIEEGIEI